MLQLIVSNKQLLWKQQDMAGPYTETQRDIHIQFVMSVKITKSKSISDELLLYGELGGGILDIATFHWNAEFR